MLSRAPTPASRVERRVPHSSRWFVKATAHPALIPQEVAGSSRQSPAIPATPRSESAALAWNPHLSPVMPEAP